MLTTGSKLGQDFFWLCIMSSIQIIFSISFYCSCTYSYKLTLLQVLFCKYFWAQDRGITNILYLVVACHFIKLLSKYLEAGSFVGELVRCFRQSSLYIFHARFDVCLDVWSGGNGGYVTRVRIFLWQQGIGLGLDSLLNFNRMLSLVIPVCVIISVLLTLFARFLISLVDLQ